MLSWFWAQSIPEFVLERERETQREREREREKGGVDQHEPKIENNISENTLPLIQYCPQPIYGLPKEIPRLVMCFNVAVCSVLKM